MKLIDAAKANGISRYVIVSSMGADNPPPGDDTFAVYLRAKAAADEALAGSGLDYTIVRPGSLTNDPGDRGSTPPSTSGRGRIARDDVAATLVGPRRAGDDRKDVRDPLRREGNSRGAA